MDTKKFLLGTLAGTVTSFIVGFLIYGLALQSYMASNTMAGVNKATPDFLWLVLAHVCFAMAVTYIFMKWAGISTIGAGAAGAFVIGLLISLGYDFSMYGTSNIMSGMSMIAVDAVASAVIWAAGGAGVGWALGLGGGGERGMRLKGPG
jgi:hypothetical protein